jgi:hypothetical protein
MGQLGKYTTYVGGAATPAHTLLSTLYPDGPFATQLSNGDEAKAQAAVLAVATSNPGPDPNGGGIQPAGGIQAGDLGMFPIGVDLTFSGQTLSPPNSPPDTSKVVWTNPGDPANGYIPDITSPTAGPGHTEGTDKTGNPTGTIPEIVAESTDTDASGEDLRNPIKDGPAIYGNNALGQPQTLGDSGGNV